MYVDTSALGRVALGEADAPAIRATLARFDPWYASELLLDAIHLAAAIDLHASGKITAVLTYDAQLQGGCRHHGIVVEAPPT